MPFIMQVLVDGEWKDVSQKGKPPYTYDTHEEADWALRRNYHDATLLGDRSTARVKEVTDE